jgi:hypothetical protein
VEEPEVLDGDVVRDVRHARDDSRSGERLSFRRWRPR